MGRTYKGNVCVFLFPFLHRLFIVVISLPEELHLSYLCSTYTRGSCFLLISLDTKNINNFCLFINLLCFGFAAWNPIHCQHIECHNAINKPAVKVPLFCQRSNLTIWRWGWLHFAPGVGHGDVQLTKSSWVAKRIEKPFKTKGVRAL